MVNFIKILVATFFYGMCYILLNESVKKDNSEDFVFTFFFALFSFAAGILFTCDIIEQLIKNTKMKQTLKNIKQTFKNVFKRKMKYNLHFIRESDNNWYINLPEWPFQHHNLMMVAGADKLCALLSDDNTNTYVEVIPSDKYMIIPEYACLTLQGRSSTVGGATYSVTNLTGFEEDIWLCPVTIFVLGHFPKYIYIRKQEK